jgi:hypothetical protein
VVGATAHAATAAAGTTIANSPREKQHEAMRCLKRRITAWGGIHLLAGYVPTRQVSPTGTVAVGTYSSADERVSCQVRDPAVIAGDAVGRGCQRLHGCFTRFPVACGFTSP